MRRTLLIALALCLFVGTSGIRGQSPEVSDKHTPVVAVLPFADYTDRQEAKVIVSLLEEEFELAGFSVVRSAQIRSTLREYRIRTAGMIDAANAKLVADRWRADFLLLGSLDFFRDDTVPEAAFSVRLLDAKTLRIVWARSVAATGADHTKLLGLGRITGMPALLRELVDEATREIRESNFLSRAGEMPDSTQRKAAIVIFDNLSTSRRAGEIVSSVIIDALIAEGIEVLEPGIVIEAFRSRNLHARGGISLEVLQLLRAEHDIDFVLTGTVDTFHPGRPSAGRSFPEVQLGGRLVDAESGLVIAARERHQKGGDSESMLGMGATRAIGDLCSDVHKHLVDELLSDSRTNYANRR